LAARCGRGRHGSSGSKERVIGVIVVGVNRSAGAKAALRFPLEEARLRQATLRVVHAIGSFGSHRPLEWGDVRAVHRAAEELLENVTREVAGEFDDVEIERRVVEGPPTSGLVDESRGADLLVVGSRGHGGFPGLLLGAVSQQCAQHAACPVVIVHKPEE
jgi:nucleotide-binding universal stress UspA family protein